jgi:hypothetical protein
MFWVILGHSFLYGRFDYNHPVGYQNLQHIFDVQAHTWRFQLIFGAELAVDVCCSVLRTHTRSFSFSVCLRLGLSFSLLINADFLLCLLFVGLWLTRTDLLLPEWLPGHLGRARHAVPQRTSR